MFSGLAIGDGAEQISGDIFRDNPFSVEKNIGRRQVLSLRHNIFAEETLWFMANAYHLKRLSLLVSKLRGRYVPQKELVEYIEAQVAASFPESTGYSLRTLQRDFKTLRESFGIDICYKDGRGYSIEDNAADTDRYAVLLQNFEILSSIYSDSVMQRYVIPEHRRLDTNVDFSDIFTALKESRLMEFDYTYVRYGNAVSRKIVRPYCLKESQHRWYLVAVDTKDDVMKCFAVDRMSRAEVVSKRFVRDEGLDIPALFRESYGIWNDLRDPVEDIRAINKELFAYNDSLSQKPQVIAANKLDVLYGEEKDIAMELLKTELEPEGMKIFPISAATGEGIDELLFYVQDMLKNIDEEPIVFAKEFFPESMETSTEPYFVEYDEEEKVYVVEGPRIEKMLGYTNIDSEKGFEFFQKFLKTNGILDELEALGIQDGDTVRMYGLQFDYYK